MKFLEMLAFIIIFSLFAYTTYAFSASAVSTLEKQSTVEQSDELHTKISEMSLHQIYNKWQDQNSVTVKLNQCIK